MKIALGQIEILPGHPDLNCKSMLTMIEQAKQQHVDIIVFPEMAIPAIY